MIGAGLYHFGFWVMNYEERFALLRHEALSLSQSSFKSLLEQGYWAVVGGDCSQTPKRFAHNFCA